MGRLWQDLSGAMRDKSHPALRVTGRAGSGILDYRKVAEPVEPGGVIAALPVIGRVRRWIFALCGGLIASYTFAATTGNATGESSYEF